MLGLKSVYRPLPAFLATYIAMSAFRTSSDSPIPAVETAMPMLAVTESCRPSKRNGA